MFDVKDYRGLGNVPSSYDRLFEQAGRRSMFLSRPWFDNFEKEIVRSPAQVRIYGVERRVGGGDPAGALLFEQDPAKYSWIAPRVFRGLSNYYSSYFGPVIADHGNECRDVCDALAGALWRDRTEWDVINLHPLDPQSVEFSSIVEAFQAVGMKVQTYFCFHNWFLRVGGRSFRQYHDSLPTIVKETIKRKGRKLERDGHAKFEIITNFSGLDRGIAAYEAVYRSSWKRPEPYSTFMSSLIRTCAGAGWLRLGIAWIDGEPAAAQLWIVHSGTASIFKLAYDERFSKMSLGTLLTNRLMEYVIDTDKVCEVDYLTGDDNYKKDWMSDRRERWGIIAFNARSVRGWLQIVRHIGGHALKRAWCNTVGYHQQKSADNHPLR